MNELENRNYLFQTRKTKDYLLMYMYNKLKESELNDTYLIETIGFDEKLVLIMSIIQTSGMKYGDALTLSYISRFYKEGLTYSEIAWIKDITEDGVRHHIRNLVPKREMQEFKYINHKSRDVLMDKIFYFEILPLIEKNGYNDVRDKFNYSDSYFERMVKRIRKLDFEVN